MDSNNNFIGYYQIGNLSICDKLIQYWKESPNKKPGRSYRPEGDSVIDVDWKDSLDVSIGSDDQSDLFEDYILELKMAVEKYKKDFPYSAGFSSWKITEGANLQYYKAGAGFKAWHCERGSASYPMCTRHLAWMTYLNSVDDGGGTEFYHQNLTIKAKKGLTLIWPADWTYTHRGEISSTQEKYIITGWFNYF